MSDWPEGDGITVSEQFLAEKRVILDTFDVAHVHSQHHRVSASHGNVAEAALRNWLEKFLPKQYGVSSGYILSQQPNPSRRLSHYDIIIYDQLRSPVLWIEENADSSKQGTSKAIPAEYVLAVLEVKSVLTRRSAKEAMGKLEELRPLLQQTDALDEPYPKHLPQAFTMLTVFFDSGISGQKRYNTMPVLIPDLPLRGYQGAVVLRPKKEEPKLTARLLYVRSTEPMESADWGSMVSSHEEYGEHDFANIMIMVAPIMFQMFAFDLVKMLEGKYRADRMSSLHALDY